jgi:hypothetical protein
LQAVMVIAIIALPGIVSHGDRAMRTQMQQQGQQGPSQQERIDDLDKEFGPVGLPERR